MAAEHSSCEQAAQCVQWDSWDKPLSAVIPMGTALEKLKSRASQEVTLLLFIPKDNYLLRHHLHVDNIQSQINPAHNTGFNIIFHLRLNFPCDIPPYGATNNKIHPFSYALARYMSVSLTNLAIYLIN